MNNLEVALEPKDVKPLLVQALDIIKDQALVNLRSYGIKVVTGKLEESFVTNPGKSTKVASAWTKVGKKLVPEAHLIEFGHRIVGHKTLFGGKKDTGKLVPARPFFRHAVDSKKAEVRKTINEGIIKLLFDSKK